jgi:hypothetical protein
MGVRRWDLSRRVSHSRPAFKRRVLMRRPLQTSTMLYDLNRLACVRSPSPPLLFPLTRPPTASYSPVGFQQPGMMQPQQTGYGMQQGFPSQPQLFAQQTGMPQQQQQPQYGQNQYPQQRQVSLSLPISCRLELTIGVVLTNEPRTHPFPFRTLSVLLCSVMTLVHHLYLSAQEIVL